MFSHVRHISGLARIKLSDLSMVTTVYNLLRDMNYTPIWALVLSVDDSNSNADSLTHLGFAGRKFLLKLS